MGMTMHLSSQQVCPGDSGSITWEFWPDISDDEIVALQVLDDFPLRPAESKTLYALQTPTNYDNYFGSRTRGFIHVESNTTATFNITGDRKANFYLSTDDSPDNLQLLCYTDQGSSVAEHDKETNQTSVQVSFLAGQNYYFELLHVDNWGTDHAQVYWKTPLYSTTEWNIIRAVNLLNVDCLPAPCPIKGTPCDDGDATTSDDIEDGKCNCMGTPTPSASLLIGERSRVTHYVYDGITGSSISSLETAPNFPDAPSTSNYLKDFLEFDDEVDNEAYGSYIQAYLIVPVTGTYRFAVTGDDNTTFYISSDETEANKMANSVSVTGWTYTAELDKYPEQLSGDIDLIAGQAYYVELKHKEGVGGDHFRVFWKTPFSGVDAWKSLSSVYLWDYTGEMFSVPENTPCNDGDDSTIGDVIGADGVCAGTPCEGAGCGGTASNYEDIAKCGTTDKLQNTPESQWLSCQTSPSPKDGTDSHWIMYDLGQSYTVTSAQIYNYNVPGQLGQGFLQTEIAYSNNGTTWNVIGTLNWPLATGEDGYTGFTLNGFADFTARYILFTSMNNNTSCKGLGKVAFTTVQCSTLGLPCDDGDPATSLDVYDEDCNCVGLNPEDNDCGQSTLVLDNSLIETSEYNASESVTTQSIIRSGSTVGFVAGEAIVLEPGFESQPDAAFTATIDPCTQTARERAISALRAREKKKPVVPETDFQMEKLIVQTPDENGKFIIQYLIDDPGKATLTIEKNGSPVYKLLNVDLLNGGNFYKNVSTKHLEAGIYEVKLVTSSYTEVKKLVVTK